VVFLFRGSIVLPLLLALVVAGCGDNLVEAQPPEQAVAERAQARWNALLAGDWETAYDFASPAYRGLVDVPGFRARLGGQASWLGATVRDVQCRDEVCEAVVRLKFMSPPPIIGGELETDYKEKWINADGEWWIFLKP
jgi:hypothetical protein